MTSEVEICNIALGWLGAQPISSFSDQSTTAELCANNYPTIRDSVLESAQWTFATDRYTSTSSVVTQWGDWYEHPVPPGWLNVMRVYREINDITRPVISQGWKLEGVNVIAEQPTVYFWGIIRITDTSKFSQLFVQALAARIAADLSVPITHDSDLQKVMWGLYEEKMNTAKAQDGKQGANERERSTILTERAR